MIESFHHRGLARLFLADDVRRIRPDLVERCRRRLAVLHVAEELSHMNIPGFNFYRL